MEVFILFLSCLHLGGTEDILKSFAPLHLPLIFRNNHNLRTKCLDDASCPYKPFVENSLCWGYEKSCHSSNFYSNFTCSGHHKGWVESKEKQRDLFYSQGDFGYVKQFRNSVKTFCHGSEPDSTSLECSENLQFCRARNLFIDFRHLKNRKEPVRYHMDVLSPGKIGGKCSLNQSLLLKNLEFMSPLQSWAPEMRYFSTDFQGGAISAYSPHCDIWVEKPTIITKLDASVSMYHHFCDFFNLYSSQHVNLSLHSDPFSLDTQILIWETYPYASNFAVSWNAFTKNPLWNLEKVAGKRICFRSVIFPLLPRMIFGLFYNTPIIWGCEKSGLFHAFSHHFLHRLGVAPRDFPKKGEPLRITFISRQTKYRRVLNEDSLLRALGDNTAYIVKKVSFSHRMPFVEQLEEVQNTDVLIGMHGAGLTHLLFLPDWATVVELYNCEDPHCYSDLARLRGVDYFTWQDKSKVYPEDEGEHPQLGAHEKFTNYRFDEEEFVKLVHKASKSVWQNLAASQGQTEKSTREGREEL